MINTMERRKIQKTGIATYTISLPKSWILKNNVKAGDVLSIFEEKDQSLNISLHEKKSAVKEAIINISKFNNELEVIRKFTAHYLNGATKVIVLSNRAISSEYMKNIISQIKKVIGFEIIEETENKLVLQDFFTSTYLSIKKAIRRAFNISKLMLDETKRILNQEEASLENVILWEDEVNRLYLLVRRQINFAIHNSFILKQLNISLKESQDFLLLIGSIEKICDVLVMIARNAIQINKVSDDTLGYINTIFEKILEAYKLAFDSIYKKSFSLSNTALEKNNKIQITSKALKKEKVDEESKRILYQILFNLLTITNFNNEIAEIGLDMC